MCVKPKLTLLFASHLSKDSGDTKILSTCWPTGGLTISIQDIFDVVALLLDYLVPDMQAITNALASAVEAVIGPLLRSSFPQIYAIFQLVLSILEYDLDNIIRLISNTFNIDFPTIPNINDYLNFDFDFGMLDTISDFGSLFTDLLDMVKITSTAMGQTVPFTN